MAKRKKSREDERRDEIQQNIKSLLEAAVSWHEENLEPDMVEATKYYNGDPFGDEEEGRSQVVSLDVHDVTQGQLPSLMRIFMGGEDAVEFAPEGPQEVDVARQMTEYVKHIVREQNPGFLEYQAAFKDALIRRIGILKWWHEPLVRVKASVHEGLDMQAILALAQDPEVSDFEVIEVQDAGGQELLTVRVTRRDINGKIRFQAVPPEEFVFTEDARDLGSAPLVAHVREVAREELIALGIDEEEIDEAIEEAEQRDQMGDDRLEQTRQIDRGSAPDLEEGTDPSQRPVLFAEAYSLVDGDDNDEAELRLFWCLGPNYRIVNGDGLGEIVDEIPFSIGTPDPEPHTIIGRSNYDDQKDVQRVKSQVLRGTLNSLAAAIEPRIAADDGRVNLEDLMSPEIGSPIRTEGRPSDVLMEFGHTFIGHATLPFMEYYDRVIRQARSGWDQSAAGLAPGDLQSSTRTGVEAHLGASQQRIELIAMGFAETLVKPLYRGILGLAIKHQIRPRTVELRGQWVTVDPRHWAVDQRIRVNITVGQGTIEQRASALMAALGMQKEMMQLGAPFITWVEIRHTAAQLMAMAGRRDTDLIFAPWGPEQQQAFEQQQAQSPPPPDPTEMLAQIEMQRVQIEQSKAQMQAQFDAQKLQLEHMKIQLQDDRERDKLARESALKEYEIELKHQAEIEDSQLKAKVAADRAAMDADVKREAAKAQGRAKRGAGEE